MKQPEYSKNQTQSIIHDSPNQADAQTENLLKLLEEQEAIRKNKLPSVRTVLAVLSSKGVVFDTDALKQKIVMTYPDATVFFLTTTGQAIGPKAPGKVDLLVDFTSPRSRQGWFYARKLRRMAKFAVGRNAGLFRKSIYNRIVDEKKMADLPSDLLDRERLVQRKVLELVGITIAQKGETGPDLGQSIALDLPPMARL
ncbi:MAG: hypothetical protein JNL01_07220 [Bdellovibrionales bacterium]|nr:hypothetical protein [Bdellovibrionales bacterium]